MTLLVPLVHNFAEGVHEMLWFYSHGYLIYLIKVFLIELTDYSIQDVRLIPDNLYVPYIGRVEMLVDDTWGNLIQISDTETSVICRYLGYR